MTTFTFETSCFGAIESMLKISSNLCPDVISIRWDDEGCTFYINVCSTSGIMSFTIPANNKGGDPHFKYTTTGSGVYYTRPKTLKNAINAVSRTKPNAIRFHFDPDGNAAVTVSSIHSTPPFDRCTLIVTGLDVDQQELETPKNPNAVLVMCAPSDLINVGKTLLFIDSKEVLISVCNKGLHFNSDGLELKGGITISTGIDDNGVMCDGQSFGAPLLVKVMEYATLGDVVKLFIHNDDPLFMEVPIEGLGELTVVIAGLITDVQ